LAARRALQIDPENAAAYGALAFLEFQRGKWSQGEELYRRALEFDPNDPDLFLSYIRFLRATGRLKEALAVGERLHMLEPFVPIYNIVRAGTMQDNGQSAASIPILETLPADAAGGFFRNQLLSRAYAAAERYSDAADTLLLITGNQVTRKSVEDAAQLLRQAPAKVSAPEALPRFDSELNFVYAHVGALDRVMEFPELAAEIGDLISTSIYAWWLPQYAPLRKTERFKAFTRKIGLVDYWRARGWPDLCRPVGADDFACD
jgi:tetratricopeptide (TPR) repeat protein